MNNNIEILHNISNKLTHINDEKQIYQLMNDGIKQIIPDSYFIITSLQPDDLNFRITHSFGFDKYISAIKTLLGKDPFKIDFPFSDLSKNKQKIFEARSLYNSEGGIYDMVNGKINKTICKGVESLLGISEVYAISFCIGENYFGGAVFFIQKSNLESGKLGKECILTIESLASQASFAINKLRDFEILEKKEKELIIANKELELQIENKTKYADELISAEEKYRIITQASLDIIFILDVKGRIVFANESMEQVLGYIPNEVFGKSFTNYVPINEIPKYFKRLTDVFKYQEIREFETVIYHKDKHPVNVEINGKLIRHEGKLAAQGTIRDISIRKQSELALKDSEKRHRFFFENTPNGVVYLNADCEIIHANSAAEKILGISLAQMKGRKSTDPRWKATHEDGSDFKTEDHPSMLTLKTGKAIKNAKMYIFNPIINSNRIININSLPKFKNGESKPYQVVATFEDITNQKNIEKELKLSKVKYSDAQSIAHLGHWDLDIVNNKLICSEEIYRIFDLDIKDSNKNINSFDDYIHPDDIEIVSKAFNDSLINKTNYEIEHRLLLKSGEIKYVQEKCITQYDNNNKPISSLGTILDITELKKTEQLLEKSNATKDKFFSIIAHDLRSPFNALLGFSNLLHTEFDNYNTVEIKRFIGFIDQGLNDTYKLLENLLYCSRAQRGFIEFNPEKINLYQLYVEINKAVIQSSESKSIKISSNIPENIDIVADKEMLSSIIRNLISNAIKFTDKLGEIIINARITSDNKSVEIFVKDNGVGISEDTQNNIFDVGVETTTYGTENEKGTGLGLILCKDFIEKHNGEIWIESKLGKGSTFYFIIPLNADNLTK